MKRKIILAVIAVIFLFMLCSCTYSSEAESGNFTIGYGTYMLSKKFNIDGAAVCRYTWDGDAENTDIVIPDSYDGQTIKRLGGYFYRGVPSPFSIDSYSAVSGADSASSMPYESVINGYTKGEDIIYQDFTLHIGKNIDNIYSNCDRVYVAAIDNKTYSYCARVYVICDEDNKTFYSRDGKLYYQENDELVDGFVYKE